jgi:hypothetical protein
LKDFKVAVDVVWNHCVHLRHSTTVEARGDAREPLRGPPLNRSGRQPR